MRREYVVIDLETTGLDMQHDEIIEVAAVKVSRGIIVDSFSTLVSCSGPLSHEVSELTGITNEMLQGQPSIIEVLPMLEEFCGDAILAAHNADFDSNFLHKYWPDERPWLDTISLAQIVWPCLPSYSLGNLSARMEIELENAHRALADAEATAKLLIMMEKELDKLPAAARRDLLTLAADVPGPLFDLVRHKCEGIGEESAAPAPAKRSSKRVVDESFRLDAREIDAYLGPNSICKDRFPGFEERASQLKMARSVTACLNEGGTLLAEAGTGTGKSLAYLLPSALYALGSGAQVAISTHTRNLQEQLLHKDIPMLSKLLDRPIDAVVVKGRSNYLCRRLYAYLRNNPPENMRIFLMRVAVWRAKSTSGDGSELNLTSYDRWKWQRICASRENCAPFCPLARNNGCIVQQTRNRAVGADLIILNHSLLVANAALENGFLPPVERLIVDEAQHLEKAAEEQLAAAVDMFDVLNMLGRLSRREKNRTTGALAAIQKYISNMPEDVSAAGCQQYLDSIQLDMESVVSASEAFFDLLNASFRGFLGNSPFYPARLRLSDSHRQSGEWLLAVQLGEGFGAALEQLAKDCFRLLDLLTVDEAEVRPPGYEELFGAASVCRDMAGTLAACLEDDDSRVAWIEFPDGSKRPSLNSAPIEIAEILHQTLLSSARSLVFTSATLAAGRDFSYFRSRIGLNFMEEPPTELMLPSPFFYRDQALFTIVNDLPDWTQASQVETAETVSRTLLQLVTASKGRAIVLFTSHHLLKAVYEQLKAPLKEQGVTLLAHGISGEVSGLLERLKREENCCILGANSFWEGVDVIGSALSLIVVVRLPFWPPNTPTTAARMERIEAAGKSSFYEYSLPQALIRFKQGFGRLIRSAGDSGVFCVLDRRIVEKSYGSRFVRSLPEMRRICASTEDVADAIRNWLK